MIEQVIDKRIKEQLGELVVQNIARQARVDELLEQNAALQQKIAELTRPGEMVPGEVHPTEQEMAAYQPKMNGAG
jgi:hypothetical protein